MNDLASLGQLSLASQFTKTRPSGPVPAEVMAVGEAPGANEELQGIPFVGQSGSEFDKMLVESGFLPQGLSSEALRVERQRTIYLTNACKFRPPGNDISAFFLDSKQLKPNELILEGIAELHQEIARVKPKLILALGNTALWALTGKRGITKWRGSMLDHTYTDCDGNPRTALLLPTYHPALILREWSWRSIAVHDMRRARAALQYGVWPGNTREFIVRPSFDHALEVINTLIGKADAAREEEPILLSSDLETRGGYIACHGLAWSRDGAICIPNMCVERPSGYFTLDQDVALWQRERVLLRHRNVRLVGQNYLYDAQYFARRRGYIPRVSDDTMFMQNVAFPGLPKGLDFLSSMYRQHHVYWKDEGKEWKSDMPEERLWLYNCEDAVATWEICQVLEGVLKSQNLWEQYRFQMRLWLPVLRMMLRGVCINNPLRAEIAQQFLEQITKTQSEIDRIVGYPINLNSPKQVMHLFYDELKFPVQRERKTKRPTCNDDALEVFQSREPLIRPLTQRIRDIRSLGVVNSNIIEAGLDADGRLRCSFNPAATETYRFNSGKNAWGGGTNMQNWTKGDEDAEAESVKGFKMPNVRRLVIPAPGRRIGSADLTGADAQTVAWEANDEDLKRVFRENKIKIHAHNAKAMFPGKCKTGYEQPYYDLARTGVHLVNYVGGIDTLAAAMGITRHEARAFQDYWFSLHPGILDWHDRVQELLETTRTVTNRFGYRRFYFDRIEGLLPEAVAWIGQSQTACVTNRAIENIESWNNYQQMVRQERAAYEHSKGELLIDSKELLTYYGFELLLQVHDEIVFQYPPEHEREVLIRLRRLAHITVPYEDPLIIPWGLKVSDRSWGECEKLAWPE